MEPDSSNPYQPPKEPGLPREAPPTKEGAYIPLVGAMIFLVLGGLSTPTPWFGVMSLAFSVAGIATASSRLQRSAGIIISAFSAVALYLGMIDAG
jgi:hypothetical protein